MKARGVLWLAVFVVLAGCGGPPHHVDSPAPGHSGTVFFGDSIFGRWDLAAFFPGQNFTNGGMFGFRTDQLLPLLPDVLSGKNVCHGLQGDAQFPLTCTSLPQPPAVIVIFAGWNDLFQGRPEPALGNLETMVTQAQASGAQVVIATLYRYDSAHPAPWMLPFTPFSTSFPYDIWLLPLNDNIRKMAERHNAVLWDLDPLFFGQADYTIDGVHPNVSGYSQMRDALAPMLARKPGGREGWPSTAPALAARAIFARERR